MIGKIIGIDDNTITVELSIDISKQPNLVGIHVVFEENSGRRIVGEIANTDLTKMLVNVVGEMDGDEFTPGSSSKPSFGSLVRIINEQELAVIFGNQEETFGQTNFGISNVYDGYKINVDINEFFSNHFAVLGNSGAGKSSTIASILQKLYQGSSPPISSSIFFFDAYGEYTNAFSKLHDKNPKVSYKTYTTNIYESGTDLLQIPIWLLDVDDLALLLDVESPTQLPIIEKTLRLVPILTGSGESVLKRKNDIIARALQDILLSGSDSTKIRDQVVGVLTKFNTPTLNLESQIVQPGYTRTLKQCLFVDKTGKMQEMELVVEFIRGYIIDNEIEINPNDMNPHYSLNDLEEAMEFALISEGILKSDKVFDTANIVNVRLHTLATGAYRHYFSYPRYVTRDQYIESLMYNPATNSKAQIINFNINYIDDRMAKVITKIISRMIFLQSSASADRGSSAYHIIIEEAHRYVLKNDLDVGLLGYNIFERITKEGRKYGVFLALITQRPSELSDTCVSQCSNFIVLRTLHPGDLKYIKEMVPNVSAELVLQLKNLKPGNCIAFGNAFKVPTSMYITPPDPRPLSDNVNLRDVWYSDRTNTMNNVSGGSISDMPQPAPSPVDNNQVNMAVQSVPNNEVQNTQFFQQPNTTA